MTRSQMAEEGTARGVLPLQLVPVNLKRKRHDSDAREADVRGELDSLEEPARDFEDVDRRSASVDAPPSPELSRLKTTSTTNLKVSSQIDSELPVTVAMFKQDASRSLDTGQ